MYYAFFPDNEPMGDHRIGQVTRFSVTGYKLQFKVLKKKFVFIHPRIITI